MIVQRILIVSGTHGNEINPIWAVKKFNQQENIIQKDIEFKYIIGNPLAYEKGSRYVDADLNRSFKKRKKNNPSTNNCYEIERANFLFVRSMELILASIFCP